MSIAPMGIRAPYLSQTGPRRNRKKMVPDTEMMLDVHSCCLLRPSEIFTSDRRGAIANQMKKAQKNDTQDM